MIPVYLMIDLYRYNPIVISVLSASLKLNTNTAVVSSQKMMWHILSNTLIAITLNELHSAMHARPLNLGIVQTISYLQQ